MMIRNIRLSFPHLFKAHAFDEDDDPRFSAMFIIEKDHPQLPEIKAEIKRVISDKWGAKSVKPKLCLREGTEKDELEGFDETVMFFNASNSARPRVLDRVRDPETGKARLILDAGEGIPYAGCYVNADIDFWGQDNKFGKRVNAGLRGVQFWKHGDRFGGGGVSDAGDFDAIEENDLDDEDWGVDTGAEADDDLLD